MNFFLITLILLLLARKRSNCFEQCTGQLCLLIFFQASYAVSPREYRDRSYGKGRDDSSLGTNCVIPVIITLRFTKIFPCLPIIEIQLIYLDYWVQLESLFRFINIHTLSETRTKNLEDVGLTYHTKTTVGVLLEYECT